MLLPRVCGLAIAFALTAAAPLRRSTQRAMSAFASHSNPLLTNWAEKNYGLPPFDLIKPSIYEEALTISMEEHIAEIASIVNNVEEPTFANTVLALDRSGALFSQVCETFSNMCSSVGVPELQEVELKMAAPLAAHMNRVANFPGLFEKLDKVYEARHKGLDRLQVRLVERFHLDGVRAGARFSVEDKAKYEKIVEELAGLCTKFTQNVMADEADVFLELEDTAGLPADLVAAAKQAGAARGLQTPIVTLSRSLVEPFLTYSDNRALREKAWRLWTRRGEILEERNNLPIAVRILQLRAEQARMHGYQNYGEYATADTMAGSPQRVQQLLEEVWVRAKESVGAERQELERFVETSGLKEPAAAELEPWDWRYLAEKVRMASYTLDNSEVKNYFPLDKMVQAIFEVAHRLFGLRFLPRPDLPSYHPDVQVYEVRKGDELQAIFLHDNYARPHKRSGAWMSELRSQCYEGGTRVVPLVMNNNNFNRPESGLPKDCLLTFDDARTLFHEFGHGLHGMLSNVPYRRLASTNVLRDFVELPSQLYEHWLSEDAVLQRHARHFQTDEVLPADLLRRMQAAHGFGQGFQTIEYTASALLDARLHQVSTDLDQLDLSAWEQQQLQELGMPRAMVMRHRLPHFQHLFSGESYASAYYVYLWAEVLDADAFDAFKESGDCFHPEVAALVLQHIYSAGNSQDPAELFRQFRGRDPVIEPMLRKKGLLKN